MLKKLWVVACIVIVSALSYAIYRDIGLLKYFSSDLRNRVVGARLQKDGHIPYTYQWREGDEKKYFDSEGDYSSEINAITATPFFHTLFYPLVEFRLINVFRIWMVCQYVMWLCIVSVCWRFAETPVQKKIVIVSGVLFLFTETWINSIASGQLYLVIPFLFGAFMFCLWRKKTIWSFAAGLCAISLVLVRPNSLFIFLPFLIFLKTTTLREVVFFLIAPVIFMLYIVGSEHQRDLWMTYKTTVSRHVKSHQRNKNMSLQNIHTGDSQGSKPIVEGERIFYSENGNFFVIVNKLTGVKVSTTFLVLATFALITVLFVLFIKSSSSSSRSLYICGIFGSCLYMIADLFSPIHRHQYYTVQWLFVLLLAATLYQKREIGIYIILAIGLLLNIVNTPLIKMEHTLGEYLWLAALLILVFTYKPMISGKNTEPLNQPANN